MTMAEYEMVLIMGNENMFIILNQKAWPIKSITKIVKLGSTNQKNVLTGVFKKPNAAALPVIRNSDNALKNLLL